VQYRSHENSLISDLRVIPNFPEKYVIGSRFANSERAPSRKSQKSLHFELLIPAPLIANGHMTNGLCSVNGHWDAGVGEPQSSSWPGGRRQSRQPGVMVGIFVPRNPTALDRRRQLGGSISTVPAIPPAPAAAADERQATRVNHRRPGGRSGPRCSGWPNLTTGVLRIFR